MLKDRAKRLVSCRSPQIALRRSLGSSSPGAKKHAFSTSAPAEHHVRAALREEGIGSVLGRFKRICSRESLWGVRSRHSYLNNHNLYRISRIHVRVSLRRVRPEAVRRFMSVL